MTRCVFLLSHLRPEDDEREEDWKIIGIYDTDQAAMQAAEKARALPGFRDHPTGFHIDKYFINEDNWKSGFIVT